MTEEDPRENPRTLRGFATSAKRRVPNPRLTPTPNHCGQAGSGSEDAQVARRPAARCRALCRSALGAAWVPSARRVTSEECRAGSSLDYWYSQLYQRKTVRRSSHLPWSRMTPGTPDAAHASLCAFGRLSCVMPRPSRSASHSVSRTISRAFSSGPLPPTAHACRKLC